MRDSKDAADVQLLLRKAGRSTPRARAVLYSESPGHSLLCVMFKAHN